MSFRDQRTQAVVSVLVSIETYVSLVCRATLGRLAKDAELPYTDEKPDKLLAEAISVS